MSTSRGDGTVGRLVLTTKRQITKDLEERERKRLAKAQSLGSKPETSNSDEPFVSVLVHTRNMQRYIEQRGALDSDLMQMDVGELDLTVRASNCLRASGIDQIGDLVQRSRDDLLAIRAMGKTTLAVIEQALSMWGLKLGTKISMVGQIEHLESFIDAIVLLRANGVGTVADLVTKTKDEILTIPGLDAESVRVLENGLCKWGLSFGMYDEKTSDESVDRFVCLENAACFKDELIHAIGTLLASTGESRSACFMAYHGVKGKTATTLQKIADNAETYGLDRAVTRERIRQIILSAEKRLESNADRVKFMRWKSACSDVKVDLPRPVSSFLEPFGYQSSDDADTTYKMIERCSKIFGLDYPFERRSLTGVGTLVFNRGSESTIDAVAKLPSVAEGPYSCLSEVARSLAIDEQTLTRAIEGVEKWEFLDEMRRYFWRPPPSLPPTEYDRTGNAVLTALCKIFSVITDARTSDLTLSIARERTLRKFRTQKVPTLALEGIADRSGLFKVRQGEIVRRDGLDWCAIGRRDLALLAVCVDRGRVVSSDVLYSDLLSKGFSRENAHQIVIHSPLLVHTLSGAWDQRGIYKFVPKPEEIDLTRLTEHVRKSSHSPKGYVTKKVQRMQDIAALYIAAYNNTNLDMVTVADEAGISLRQQVNLVDSDNTAEYVDSTEGVRVILTLHLTEHPERKRKFPYLPRDSYWTITTRPIMDGSNFTDNATEHVGMNIEVTIPISPRTIVSGQYFGLDTADMDGSWVVHDGNGNPVGQVMIADRGVSGLESIVAALGLEKDNVLRLRLTVEKGEMVLVAFT